MIRVTHKVRRHLASVIEINGNAAAFKKWDQYFSDNQWAKWSNDERNIFQRHSKAFCTVNQISSKAEKDHTTMVLTSKLLFGSNQESTKRDVRTATACNQKLVGGII